MHRIKAYNARRKRKGKFFFFSFLIILCVAAILMNQTMKPLIHTLATSRAESMATITINDAVTAVMTEQQIEYSDLVTINYQLQRRWTGYFCKNQQRSGQSASGGFE